MIRLTPLSSYFNYRNFNKANSVVAKSIKSLGTGIRIQCAADDAAGMAISANIKSKILSLKQSIKNVQTGQSILQTADGGYEGLQGLLNKALKLCLQAKNQTLTADERQYLQDEYLQVLREMKNITDTTKFADELIFGDPNYAYFPISHTLNIEPYKSPTRNTDTASRIIDDRGTAVT